MAPENRESQLTPSYVPDTEDVAPSRGVRPRVEPLARSVLDAARRREPEALEAFFDAYFDPVYALAYRLLGRRAAA